MSPKNKMPRDDSFLPLDNCAPFYVPEELVRGKVISISNQEGMHIGRIVGFSIHHSGSKMPIVKFEDGVEYLCFSMLIPYTEYMHDMLLKLSKENRFAVVRDILHLNSEIKRLSRPNILKDVT